MILFRNKKIKIKKDNSHKDCCLYKTSTYSNWKRYQDSAPKQDWNLNHIEES